MRSPLLRDDDMILYPAHQACTRVHADPTLPCARCWTKYVRPYAGAPPPSSPSSAPSASAPVERAVVPAPPPRQRYPPPPPATYVSVARCAGSVMGGESGSRTIAARLLHDDKLLARRIADVSGAAAAPGPRRPLTRLYRSRPRD
ncbi:hypothetical protein DFH09DRAFT_1499359 [Mycena vulgaris]|nr:hypothetical protein DFH09DRAFT_1499359 [Mycena vulgaris]